MCDEEFFTEHSSVEDETSKLSLDIRVTNHPVTRRNIPEKQKIDTHCSESLKPRISPVFRTEKNDFPLIGCPCGRQNLKLMMLLTDSPRKCVTVKPVPQKMCCKNDYQFNVYINQRDAQIVVNSLYFFVKWLYMFRTIISPSSGATFNKLYSTAY